MPSFSSAAPSSTAASLGTNNIQALSQLMGNWIQANPSWLEQVNPYLEALKAHNNAQLSVLPSGERSHYNPTTNTVEVSSFRAIPHELGHQEQNTEGGVIPTSLLNFLQILMYGDEGRYQTPGTLEYRSENARVPLIKSQFGLK